MPTEQLSIYDFGRRLIESQDLDPTYVVVWHAGLDHEQLCKFLIGYWSFYHLGTASYLSERTEFFPALLAAIPGTVFPRSSERRHYRGAAALASAKSLQETKLTCSELVRSLGHQEEFPRLPIVLNRVKSWRGFGDWIAFKVADMLERLSLCPIQSKPEDVFTMFESPRIGAQYMWERNGKPEVNSIPLWAYGQLVRQLGHLKAPPRFERAVNIQELETVLCKYKSYCDGRYIVGKDIKEVRHSLLQFASCKTSQRLLKAGKVGQLW